MIRLGVNIDHVATLRQARKTNEPDPVEAAFIAEKNGADGITVHLREDRRHIQDRDVHMLRKTITSRLNLEMGMAEEIIKIALDVKPEQVTLVPEKREEITTEGGLDVAGSLERSKAIVERFNEKGIRVSMFIDPDEKQVAASAACGAEFVEFHTGCYANCWPYEVAMDREMQILKHSCKIAADLGIRVNAGHGLTYRNVMPVAAISNMEELNIGHSIISRAVMTGLGEAVREMKRLMVQAHGC